MIRNLIKVPAHTKREPIITPHMVRLMERQIAGLKVAASSAEAAHAEYKRRAEAEQSKAALIRNYIFAEAPDLVDRAVSHITRVRPNG